LIALALGRHADAQTTSAASQPASVAPASHPVLKRKIAIGRFSNSTRYGKALLLDSERDPLADQAADMLTARLVDAGTFLVFERGDLNVLSQEQATTPNAKLVGVDTLVVGSVTEFGRTVEGKAGFLNSKTRQVATAAVEVRLVDVRTGQAFFSTTGRGTASVEASEVAGFGGRAGYDSRINDKAISAAISDLMTNVIQKLQERRWFTDVLQVNGRELMMSGGPSQGLKVGDVLSVEVKGRTVVSGQTGLPLTLPGRAVARVQVVSFFGDNPQEEGAVGRIVDGELPPGDLSALRIVETP
jgi:curli biogenesis system outer membrane secretion channel CsgG